MPWFNFPEEFIYTYIEAEMPNVLFINVMGTPKINLFDSPHQNAISIFVNCHTIGKCKREIIMQLSSAS